MADAKSKTKERAKKASEEDKDEELQQLYRKIGLQAARMADTKLNTKESEKKTSEEADDVELMTHNNTPGLEASSKAGDNSNTKKRAKKASEQAEEAELRKILEKGGLKAFVAESLKKADAWKGTTLDIGVIGPSGSGKSTFVNAIRGVKAEDSCAAPTCVVEKTMKPTPYEHPQNANVKIWDLPGFGTPTFPKKNYMAKINFTRYHFFVLISCSRFTEEDVWFAKQVEKDGKRFYFVRTKIDDDVRHDMEDYPQTHCEEKVLAKVRENCTSELLKSVSKKPEVFLVSKHPARYDFPELEERLVAELPELQREVAVFALRSTSKKVIEEKTARLQKRAWLEASVCVTFDAKAIQRLSINLSTKRLSDVIAQYKQVYGLDADGIRHIRESSGFSEQDLMDIIKRHFWFDFTEDALIDAMEGFCTQTVSEETLASKTLGVPVIGFILNFDLSQEATKAFLLDTIETMQQALLTILDAAYSTAAPK